MFSAHARAPARVRHSPQYLSRPLFCPLPPLGLWGGIIPRVGPIESIWGRSWAAVGRLRLIVPLDLRIYSPVNKSTEAFSVGGCMGFYCVPAFWGNDKLYSSFRFHVLLLGLFLGWRLFRHKSIPPLLYPIIPRNNIYMKIYYAQIFMKIFVHSANCIFMKI